MRGGRAAPLYQGMRPPGKATEHPDFEVKNARQRTAMLRYRHYHRASDTVEKVNYPRAAQVVNALRCTLFEFAGVG